jgi:hypothetical protein
MGGSVGRRDRRWRGPELIGIALIVIGAFYLLDALDVFRFSWRIGWPILLIGIGLFFLVQAIGSPGQAGSAISVPRDGVDRLELRMSLGAGTFRLLGGGAGLIDAESTRDDIVARVERDGSRARVRLLQDVSWLPFFWRGRTEWQIRLTDEVPVALDLSAGAGDFTLDLGHLRVVDAGLSIGAAQARLVLPRPTGDVHLRVTAGASSITIEVPPGVEAKINRRGGLIELSGRTETPAYLTSSDRVTLDVSGGASSVRVV